MASRFIDKYLDKVHVINNSIEKLNHGGCGFYAYYLYKRMRAMGLKVCMRPLIWDGKVSDFNKLVNTGNGEYANHVHIVLHLIDGKTHYIIDSHEYLTGVFAAGDMVENDDNEYLLGSRIPIAVMEKALTIRGYWCKEYSVSQNSKLEVLINKTF